MTQCFFCLLQINFERLIQIPYLARDLTWPKGVLERLILNCSITIFFFRLIHYIASKHEFDQREEGGSGEQKNGTNGTTENGVKENEVVDDKEENEEEKVLICGEKEKNRESLECDKMTGSSVSEGDSAMSQVNIAVRFILNIAVRFILTLQDVFF